MMKYTWLSLMWCLLLSPTYAQYNTGFNGNMEILDARHQLAVWAGQGLPDSLTRHDGRYGMVLDSKNGTANYTIASYTIPKTYKGNKLVLKGFLKTQNVTGGYAGLWLRTEANGQRLSYDYMEKRGVTGTTDWKEYTIDIPYNDDRADKIVLGGHLLGTGTLWMDGLRLYINGQPIDEAPQKEIKLTAAQKDTAFAWRSGIDTIMLNGSQTENLKLLGEIWGLIKYHHPLVAKGEFNMDAQLFRVLPAVLKAQSKAEFNAAVEKWVDGFGVPEPCKSCRPVNAADAAHLPDYGSVFKPGALNPSLPPAAASVPLVAPHAISLTHR